MSLCDESPDMVLGNQLRAVDLFRLQEQQQLVKIALIGFQGARGQAPFIFQVDKKVCNVLLHTRSAYTTISSIEGPVDRKSVGIRRLFEVEELFFRRLRRLRRLFFVRRSKLNSVFEFRLKAFFELKNLVHE